MSVAPLGRIPLEKTCHSCLNWSRLEDEARARGVKRLVLETGDVLHSAHRLYERAGFTRCAAFGPYLKLTPPSIERCVFMEKPVSFILHQAARSL